jgi:hypothetical protein
MYSRVITTDTNVMHLTKTLGKKTHSFFNIRFIRLSLADYWATLIRPYLVLGGAIEIDETKASGNCYSNNVHII